MAHRTIDPLGRVVVFDARARNHLAQGRPEMLRHVEAILAAVHRPDVRVEDPRPLRERFYRRDLAPGRWLRVVVDFSEEPAFVITAMVQNNNPQVEKR